MRAPSEFWSVELPGALAKPARIGKHVGAGSAVSRRHPDRHGDHHQVFGQRDEAERDIARSAHARAFQLRSEEHTSELQSLMRISYAVFCLKKNTTYIYTLNLL